MCVSRTEPKTVFEQDAGIHASEHSDVAARADLQIA